MVGHREADAVEFLIFSCEAFVERIEQLDIVQVLGLWARIVSD